MSDLLLALFFIALAIIVIGMIQPRLVLPGQTRTRARVATLYGFIAVAALIGFGQAFKAERDPERPMKALASAVESITSNSAEIVAEGDSFRVKASFRPKRILSGATFVRDFGLNLIDVGDAAAKSGVPIQSVTLAGYAPSTDPYGKAEVAFAIEAKIAPDDFRKISWNSITAEQALNLAAVGVSPLGRQAVGEYCADDDNLRAAFQFCREALKR